MIHDILVLGAGSAGLLAAIACKRKLPNVSVQVVRSKELGVIGVGESTTPGLPDFLFNYLGIRRKHFYATAEPTWKMGIHFLWGPRDHFDYGFAHALDAQWSDLPRPNGFYCEDEFADADLCTALMAQKKAFPRQPNGGPEIPPWHAFHLDNPKFVRCLEAVACEIGIACIDANVAGAERGEKGISSVNLEDGRKLTADLFIDASGFRSELLGKTLEEPFVSYSPSLFCDRAVVGNWPRTDEPILPYTTAETMNAGWCWRIEHEPTVNRGYVYSSSAISDDDDARNEFLAKNPKARTWDHVVKFKSGRYRRAWVGNVMAIGNACGFVEPLEATALMVIAWQCRTFVDMLLHCGTEATPTMMNLFNDSWAATWDEIRDFLTLHYWANQRIDNAFWSRCHHETDISRLKPLLEFYEENGPTGFARHLLGNTGSQFGIEGFLVHFVGNRVPHRAKYTPSEAELKTWKQHCADNRRAAENGMGVREALSFVKHPNWQWHGDT